MGGVRIPNLEDLTAFLEVLQRVKNHILAVQYIITVILSSKVVNP